MSAIERAIDSLLPARLKVPCRYCPCACLYLISISYFSSAERVFSISAPTTSPLLLISVCGDEKCRFDVPVALHCIVVFVYASLKVMMHKRFLQNLRH